MSASNVVSLAFTADSSQAKREIQGLVRELDTLSTKTISSSFSQNISDDMKEAAREVGKFSTILQHATNIDTGKLDLSKLNQGLKAANSSIPQMANSFKALGNDGVKAFANIVKQINAAEVPMKKTNAMVDKLWTSMKNTVNWQISSSALHALMSGVQGAFRYAEDLNRSLNDIRIVTEYNAEQMAAFALEANKAAKALSTTTTAYTDASLIYFQQGLNKEEVKERADITIKMANVTRQSATEVSNQLTAIWNNFDDGTQSLEYYADILTKLGAATASSTEEIAGGLEKFAAVADTIGLSYEYAASALATITSNTRQSEEVVGTALKTIFARIQGLNLGETLDDGTTLNKYSAALESVGISIFDQSGELKKMDRILDEMGAKWETLSKNQQVALAQTVAGVRQYNQLVSLMDNWDNGDADSMAANLSTARGASGALQSQADIYADSWEAAQKRVQASWESLYDTLINDDFFVDLLDTVSGFVDVVDNLVNGLGGVKGLLLTISTYILTIAKTKFSDELKRLTGPSEKQRIAMAKDQKTQANEQLRQIASGNKSNEGQVITKTYGAISSMNQKMYDMSDKLTEEEAKIFQGQIDQIEALGEIVAAKAKALDLTERENKSAERQLQLQQKIKIATIEKLQGSGNLLNRRGKAFSQEEIDRVNQVRNSAGLENLNEEQTRVLTMDASKLSGAAKTAHLEKYKKVIAEINAELERAKTAMRNFPQSLKTYETKVKEIAEVQATMDFLPKDGAEASEQVMAAYSSMSDEMKGFVDQAAAAANKSMPELIQQLSEVKDGAIENSDVFQDLSAILSSAREQFAETTVDLISGETGMDADEIMGRTMAIDEQVDSSLNLAHAQQQLQVEIDKVNKDLDVNATKLPDWQDSIVGAVSAVTALMGALSSISGMMDTLKDPDVSGWEKFTTILMTLATVIPSIVMAFKSLKESKIKDVAVNALNVASEKLLEKAKERSAKASAKAKLAQEQETASQKKDILTNIAQSISEKKTQAKEGLKKAGQSVKNYKGLKGTFGAGAGGSAAGGAGGGAAGGGGLTAGGASLAISIGLIAAGIAVLAGGIAWAVHQAKAAERAVEKAKQAATELSENYDSVKASFDEFNNQASGYESARDAVDKLTVGTEEYAEAVRNANDVAMQLLETNKDLAYTIQDGQIIIDEESLKEQKEIEQQKLEHAQAAKMAGQVNLTRAEEDLQKRDMARKLDSSYDDDESVGNVLGATGTGAAAGALIGSAILPGIGTLVGGLIGAGVGLIGGMIADAEVGAADSKESEALEKLEKAYLEDDTVLQKLKDGSMTDADWDKIGIDDAELRASLQANADEVSTLVQEMAANTAAVNAQNDLVAANALADNEAVQNSEYQDQIIDLAGDAYGHAYDKAMESEWVDSWGKDGIAQINGANKEAKKVFDEYLKYAGLEGQGYELTDTTGNDDNRKFVYKDKEGNEHEVSLEAMQAARAAYEASGVLNESATKLAETFTKLADSTSQADQALLSFVSGKNFEEATEGELEAIQNEVGPITKNADGTYQTGNVENYLEKALGEELTDDVAIRYGYESADAMLQAFAAKLSDADEAWDSIKIPENFKFSSEMSLSTAKALESQIKNMNLGPLGEEAGKEYVEKLNTMLEGVDTEDQQKALQALTQIDWSDWDAMEQADRLMKEYGVDIDTASEEWVEFAEKMRLATGARPDFEKLKETLQNISGILKDLNFGDIISEEDYQELIAYNDEWERFFMMQADGTRKFIGDSAAMRQETRDNIAAQKADLEQRKKNQEGMKKANWSINGKAVDWHDTDSFDMVKTAETLKNTSDTGATGQVLATLGYTDEVIQELIDKYNEAVKKGDEEAINLAKERLETMYNGIGDFMEEDLAEMGQELDEMMASTATNLSELNTMVEEGTISVDAYAKQFQVLAQEAFSSAETLAELDAAMDQFQLDENDELYTQNLMRIAEGYKSCADELANYQAALSNFDPETGKGEEMLEQAEETLRAMISLEEAAKQYGLEVEVLTAQAKRLAKAYGLTEEEAAKLAVQNQRMNKGVDALTDNWEDWKKELSSSNKLTQDYAEAVVDCTAAIADLVGACEDLELPDEFFNAENMELIEKAMDGDTEAINKLGAEVAKTTVEALEFKETFAGLIADMEVFRDEPIEMNLLNRDKFEEDKLTVLNGIQAIKEGTMSAGEVMSGEWVAALNRMALTTGMSVEEMNGLLGSLGVQAKVETTYVKQPMQVPTYTERVEGLSYKKIEAPRYDENGNQVGSGYTMVPEYTKATVPGEPIEVEGYAAVAQISTEDNPLTAEVTSNVTSTGAPAATYTGNRGSVAPSVTKSGKEEKSGGSKKKEKKPEKTKLGERYKEINDALSDVADTMEDASKSVDRLYGNARIAKMKQVNNLIQSEVNLLRQKQSEAERNLITDKQALELAAKNANVTLSFDSEGNIENYTSALKIVEDRLNAVKNAAYSTGNEIDDGEQETIDDLEEKAKALEDAIAQYDETRGEIRDIENTIDDKFNEWQDNNYEMLTYSLELELQINDSDLEKVEYYLGAIEDDFYSIAEAAALMVGDANMAGISQLDIFKNNLDDQAIHIQNLQQAYADNAISQADFVSGMQESQSAIYENLTSIRELDKTMKEYYAEALDQVNEKLDEHIAKIDHVAEKLDHYKNIMSTLGKDTNYEAMNTVLEGIEDVSKNSVDAAKGALDLYNNKAKEQLALYQEALAKGDQVAAEMYYKYYTDALNMATEAEKEYMSSLEAWAQAARDVLENKLSGFARDLEKSLTGGSSFDQINTQMERAVSLQEEYLTTTNQIYETNKMMRTAQQELDKSTSSVAKSKLSNFIKETEQLQNQGQLSQYELDIQQAKYDLLLAEIALQDAQESKSVVRLQRDAEGNFGYVYTADQNQVDQAQQQFEDAQNALYNIGLEGANNYTEKYQQTLNEFYTTMTELNQAYLEGAFGSEAEYQAAVDAAKQQYYAQLQNYSKLYSVAIATDSRVVADAWSTDFADMTTQTDHWMQAVDGYVYQVEGAFKEWDATVASIEKTSGTGLDNLATSVTSIVDESDKLINTLNGKDGLISSLSNELTEVTKVTSGYAAMRQEILGVISAYEIFARSMGNYAGSNNNNGSMTFGSFDNSSSSGSGNGSSSSGNGSSGSGGSTGSSDDKGITYTVQPGDTLSEIGAAYGVPWQTIYKKNKDIINDPNLIFPGQVLKFDSGGYTGEWGSYGKLAVLHEKELVLNAHDTENLLTSLTVLDSIMASLELQSQQMQYSSLMSPNYGGASSEVLEQKVHIEASFPNVSSHGEIEEALNNLINQASQYANRK